MQPASPGRIITFYSYKGGTGRSMALANVAWILASNGKRVLMIDWDLEAPGLHRYFSPFLKDKELTSTEGLIDFVVDFASEAMTPAEDPEKPLDPDWYLPLANIRRYAQSLEWKFEKAGLIDFVPAGRQGPEYATAVNSFNWKAFYERHNGGAFLEATRKAMLRDYDFVLIDSRTGVSDTSGICTIQMPDDVVVCFTLNRQSISGAAAAACSIAAQRELDDNRRVRIFPVPMRVDEGEKDKLAWARAEAHENFDEILKPHMPSQELRRTYWNEIEVLYSPYYAYEEVLAVFADRFKGKASMLKAMELLSRYVTGIRELHPEAKETSGRIVLAYSRQPKTAAAESLPAAVAVLDRLTAGEQAAAVRVLARFIRYASAAGGDDAPRNASMSEMADLSQKKLAQDLLHSGVLRPASPGDESLMALADPNVIRDWQPLNAYISESRVFLRWRQDLAEKARSWQKKEPGSSLLGPSDLQLARGWPKLRPGEFAEAEKQYIAASSRRIVTYAAIGVALIAAIAIGIFLWQRSYYRLFKRLMDDAPVNTVLSANSSDRLDAISAWTRGLLLDNRPLAAVETLDKLPDPRLRVQAKARHAELLYALGKNESANTLLQSALSDAQADKSNTQRDISDVAQAYADGGNLNTAGKLWNSVGGATVPLPSLSSPPTLPAEDRFDRLVAAAKAYQQAGNASAALSTWQQALSAASSLDLDSQPAAFAQVAKGLADAHEYRRAFALASGITRAPNKLTAYGDILAARGLEEHPEYAKALAAAQKKGANQR